MSSFKAPDYVKHAFLVALAVNLAGCGFRPLYLDKDTPTAGVQQNAGIGRDLSSIAVQLGDTREKIALRNNLIFNLTGGGDETANPTYRLEYNLAKTAAGLAVEAISGRQSTAFVSFQADFRLIETSTGKVAFTGRSIGRASFDKPAQRFAGLRAERDAEDRALTDLAEAVRNTLASYFAQKARPNT